MFSRLLLLAVFVVTCSAAAPVLSPEARALIAPNFDAYERIDREHAALGRRAE